MVDTLQGGSLPELSQALEAAETAALRAGQIVRRLRELVARGNVTMRTEDLPRLIDEASVLGFVDSQLLGISHQVRTRSEEHKSELQSLMRISYALFCLKKKK